MIDSIADAVRHVLDERGPPIVVALDGRIGAGKSTVASALADRLPATVIPTDDFFAAEITDAGWDARTAAERARDGIDWRRMRQSALDIRLARLAARDKPAFLAAWHQRWDAAEDYYFTKVRPRSAFDLVIAG